MFGNIGRVAIQTGIIILAIVVVIVWIVKVYSSPKTKEYNAVTVIGTSTSALYLALMLRGYGFKVTVRSPAIGEKIEEHVVTIGDKRVDAGLKQDISLRYGLAEYKLANDLVMSTTGETVTAYPVEHITSMAPGINMNLHEMRGFVTQSDVATLAEYGGMSRMLYDWLASFTPSKTSVLNSYSMVDYIHGQFNGPATKVPMHRASTGVVTGATIPWGNSYVAQHQSHDGMSRIRTYLINHLRSIKVALHLDAANGVTSISHPSSGGILKPVLTLVDGTKIESNHVVVACDPRLLVSHPLLSIINPQTITHTNIFVVAMDAPLDAVRNMFPSPTRRVILPFGANNVMTTPTISMLYIKPMLNGRCGLVAMGYQPIIESTQQEGVFEPLDPTNIASFVETQFSSIGALLVTTEAQIYPHNIRYTQVAIDNMIPRQVGQQQGVGNVWYAGELFSHSDTTSQMTFGYRLAYAMSQRVRPELPVVQK